MNNVQSSFDFIFSCLLGLWNCIRDYWFLCSLPAAFVLWLVISLVRGSIDR